MAEYQLKNGQVTKDKRLDRLVQFDERSKQYPVRALIAPVAKPRSYSWKCGIVLDQGNDGACVGFSMSHELAARPQVVSNVTYNSGMYVYHQAQTLDEWAGEAYDGTSVIAGAKALAADGYFKEYRWAFGLDDLILALGHQGPAVIGINWYDDMFNPDSHGLIKVGGALAGGHAILVNGVNIKKKQFKLHNSWGPSWGIDGECYISFDDMSRLLAEQGEACIPVQRTTKKAFTEA